MLMAINPLEYLIDPHRRIYWVFLLSSVVIAAIFLCLRLLDHYSLKKSPFGQKLDFSTPYLCKDLAKYFKKQHSAPLKYPQFVTA